VSGRSTLEEQAELVRQQLDPTAPSVVLLQECDRGMVRSGSVDQPARFAELLGLPGVVFGSNLRRDCGQYGTAILTDLALCGVEHLLLESQSTGHVTHLDGTIHGQEQRGLLLARCTGDLLIVNVHASVWAAERRTMRDELAEIARHHRGPLIVAGDFNSDDPTEDLRIAGLADTAGGNDAPTFPSGDPIARIDRILVRGLETVAHRNTPTLLSDHHLVSAGLEPAGRAVPHPAW
jgi:endonuclease/exonuclease/phosphatase family metal-dependent hydrolase